MKLLLIANREISPMSLFTKFFVFVCLASGSILFSSCENPAEIGFDFTGDNQKGVFYVDTLNLFSETVLDDSSDTGTNSLYTMIGSVNDPTMGKINAISYVQPNINHFAKASNIDSLTIDNIATYDSLFLVILASGPIYGDTLSKNTFSIYRLRSSLDTSKRYNSTQKQDYLDRTPIFTFSVNYSDIRKYDTTSKVWVPIYYRLKLPIGLAKELVEAAIKSKNDPRNFPKSYSGWAIEGSSSNKSIISMRVGPLYNVSDPNSLATSELFAYCTTKDKKTRLVPFDFNGARYSQLDVNRSGTIIQNLGINKPMSYAQGRNQLFVQAGVGINSRVSLSSVAKLSKNMDIVRADLQFTSPNSSKSVFHPSGTKFVFFPSEGSKPKRGSNGARLYITSSGDFSDLGGLAASLDTSGTLQVNFTNYLRNLNREGSLANSYLYIAPAYESSSSINVYAKDILNRTLFDKPKLLLYYRPK
ncbi:MAG: hypothetical protein ACRCVT_08030 [Leadbetterella sp.]